jgi:HAD superfamily hydrolase (TIGR01459 family)|tara:strand:+ start:195 stop:1001 length:807 start_codon:yes stop_codon:yes gene_type:complete
LKKLNHLAEIYKNYDTYIIDLWGVIHNGVELNSKAVEVVKNLTQSRKKVVFLSNAPRPSKDVKKFLQGLKMEDKYLQNIMTSGEAAMLALEKESYGKFFYHLGPERDNSVFFKIKENKTTLEKCNFILCTGLFDHKQESLDYYKDLLNKHTSKKLICTNPDLTVHRGNVEEYCAGSIAKIFELLGGETVYFGKPYKEIYKICFGKEEKVVAIGDNLNTDIKGANNMKIDSIFISNGVHRSEYKQESELSELANKYKVNANYYQPELIW